ncbi:MAG: RNA polymerase-binding protein DksA [Mariprofundaceae bacterium]|nr:RNA polymerase-binding protein DksA [Mariprofundaceae bacterium]
MALNKEQLNDFEILLKKWRDELQETHSLSIQNMQEEPGVYPDPNDQASIETERDFDIRIKDRERQLIRKIDQAIVRVREDQYGICDSCGAGIAYKRLMARPVTTLCIECKNEQEQGERTHT